MIVLQLFAVFSALSLMAIGGGAAVLPEMQQIVVHHMGWLTDEQFVQVYGLGQLAPGPNTVMVSVIGWRVAGLAGSLAALIGFFLPAGLLTFFCARVWDRYAASPWRIAAQQGLAPITIGLMLAGVAVLARGVVHGPVSAGIVVVTTLILLLSRTPPVLLIFAGAAAHWLLGH